MQQSITANLLYAKGHFDIILQTDYFANGIKVLL